MDSIPYQVGGSLTSCSDCLVLDCSDSFIVSEFNCDAQLCFNWFFSIVRL